MLERLDRAFDSQRRFVANASHELRTPLTINRALIDVALDDPQAGETLRQLGTHLLAVDQRHERLIDGLLTLASSEERLSTRSPIDLADIAERAATAAHAAAREAGVEIRSMLGTAPVAGDPILLERLAHNIIDNAIRYNTPRTGWVKVSTGLDDRNARLTVENPGPHVPPDEIPGLFEPFRRLATTDPHATPDGSHGAGLGLSIVRSVAHAHGGDVHATHRPDGGLTVSVHLPARIDNGEHEALYIEVAPASAPRKTHPTPAEPPTAVRLVAGTADRALPRPWKAGVSYVDSSARGATSMMACVACRAGPDARRASLTRLLGPADTVLDR